MISSLPFDALLLLLRGATVLLLYLFLVLVLMTIGRDVRLAARVPRAVRRSTLGQLVLVEPGPTGLENGAAFPLAAVSSIGRAVRSTVSLDDEFLSAEHALLSWRDGTWWVEDLGSRNGTFVNGVRVTRTVPVSIGDVIEVGRVALRLE